jgi:putative polyhydroxyalkanoate system protein
MIVVRRQHDLGLARAKRLAETMARRLQDDYGGSYTWEGSELHFQRTGASGRVTVTKDSFQIRVELGFLLGALHSRIEREVRAFCDEHFGQEGPSAPVNPARSATRRRRDPGSGRPK